MRRKLSNDYLFALAFSIYIAFVLWLTVLSRIGTIIQGIHYPFQSYFEFLSGDVTVLKQNIENVIMFVPLGIALKCLNYSSKRVAIVGTICSCVIETIQLIFKIGIVEVDDIIHNSIGVAIGIYISKRISFIINDRRKMIMCIFVLSIVLVIPPTYSKVTHVKKMKNYATMNDDENGQKNLLVMKGINGYAWNSDVYVKYLDDGSIRIRGNSDKTTWYPIADISLKKGEYEFAGLSGVDEKTVGLVIEADNKRLTSDIGPNDKDIFVLNKTTTVKVYVIVYKDCNCDIVASPVLYKRN